MWEVKESQAGSQLFWGSETNKCAKMELQIQLQKITVSQACKKYMVSVVSVELITLLCIVSFPDLIKCVYHFQYNVRENSLVDIACIP